MDCFQGTRFFYRGIYLLPEKWENVVLFYGKYFEWNIFYFTSSISALLFIKNGENLVIHRIFLRCRFRLIKTIQFKVGDFDISNESDYGNYREKPYSATANIKYLITPKTLILTFHKGVNRLLEGTVLLGKDTTVSLWNPQQPQKNQAWASKRECCVHCEKARDPYIMSFWNPRKL